MIWTVSCFNNWWSRVSTSLLVLKTTSSNSLFISEEYHIMTRQYIKDTPSVLMIIFINEKANVICNTYGNG